MLVLWSQTTSLVIILALKWVVCSETLIPKHLVDCYASPPPLLPMTMETMIEIIRKVSNRQYYAPMSLTQQTSDIINWFSIDGIERSPNAMNMKNVVPYNRNSFKAIKQDLLFDKLITIQRRPFDAFFLSKSEKCSLHSMLSASVDYWQRGDEAQTCPDSPQQFRNMSANGSGGPGMYSVCPVVRGVVLTSGGTISASRLLAALLAALTPQHVLLSYLLSSEQLIASRMLPNDTISNIWAATLAGNLAEVSVEQSRLYDTELQIGIPGRWNNTDVPSHFYIDKVPFSIIERHQWQMTDAEILGGIDGLIIGKMIKRLGTSESNTLRLDQILEMYYSDMSPVSQDHVCNRNYMFANLMRENERTLIDQTIRFAALLSMKTTTYFVDSSVMTDRCIKAVKKFSDYKYSLLSRETCSTERRRINPKINMFVFLDSTWSPYSTLQFLMSLKKRFDISYYGGSITVINGDSSTTRVNSTSDVSTLYWNMQNGTQNDPNMLRLHNSFTCLKNILEGENMREKSSLDPRNAKRDVVLVLGYSSTISDKDMEYTKDILKSIQTQNPGVEYLYIASFVNEDKFRPLLHVGSVSGQILSLGDAERNTIVENIHSATKPERSLKPAYCTNKKHQWPEVLYNEYITPSKTNVYWIHPSYFDGSLEIVKITFKTYDYGELEVCMTQGETEQRGDCKQARSDTEVTHTVLRPCNTATSCAPLYFAVSVLKTTNKCTEYDCRFPSQVKFSIIVQDLHCINLDDKIQSKACSSCSMLNKFVFFLLFSIRFI